MNKDMSFRLQYQKARISYYGNAVARRLIGRNLTEPHFEREVLSAQAGNDRLRSLVEAGEPFAAARFGGIEAQTIADVLYHRAGGRLGGVTDYTLRRVANNAGFFPMERNAVDRLADLYLTACHDIDYLGVWNVMLQSYYTEHFLPQAVLAELGMFEPYYFENPWTAALYQKKVVVVHPFAKSIQKQYLKREQLFQNKEILPQFELRTVKAVQTIAGERDERFATWFEALDYMYEECMCEDFDIALIGCGAYGFPLAARLKRAGKQAVHIGGALQILFGIKGGRWDHHEVISGFYNDAWVRPMESEQIKKSDAVEKSCYW